MKKTIFIISIIFLSAAAAFAQTARFDVALTPDSSGVIITGFTGNASAVTIPANLEGLPVKGIGKGAFSNKTGIRSVTVPRGVTIIESEAFLGSRALTSVTLPDTLKTIGDRAFASTGLTSIKLPDNCTEIGEGAFESCRTLKTVYLPADLAIIPIKMFLGCEVLNQIDFPASIKSAGSKAFGDCRSLATVNVPASVQKIDFADDAFAGCPKINLGGQVALKKIGYSGAF